MDHVTAFQKIGNLALSLSSFSFQTRAGWSVFSSSTCANGRCAGDDAERAARFAPGVLWYRGVVSETTLTKHDCVCANCSDL